MALKEKTKSKEKVKEEKKGKGKRGTGTSGTSYAGVSHAVGGTQTGDLTQDSFRGYRGGNYRPPETIIRSSNTAPATAPAGGAPRVSGGYAALRSSMEDYDPAPVMTYEQATAQAQRSYDKYRAKQKAFDEKYGGLEHPEQYYGYRQRSQELGRLQEECVKMVDLMRRHYREMDVEPLFTLSGPVEDPEPYQQQVSAMMSEMEDYIEASNGLPDPTALNQMQTNIVRLQAAIGDLPTEAPHEEVLLQVLGGNYYDNVTMGGTAAQIGLGLSGLDLPMDLRDLSYDLGHLRTTPWSQTAVDVLALLPVVGALKYTDEAAELGQAARRADDLAEGVDEFSDAARATQRLTETGAETAREADAVINMRPGVNKPEELYLNPRSALDEDWYRKYNAAKEYYAQAAANSGTADTVTYYRVQTAADNSVRGTRSRESIGVNPDGSISILSRNRNLDISAYTDQHYQYYSGENKRPGSYVVAFEVPRWFDEFVRQEAIIQNHYRTNPLNQRGAAPQMTDLTSAGFKFSLPPIWHEWLEEYATGARILMGGG